MKLLEKIFLRRPRILNHLHKWHLIDPISQTNETELATLEKYSFGRRSAVEIGTLQGVSAARIARALASDGVLFCVDPWEAGEGRVNPSLSICQRHLATLGLQRRVRFICEFSHEAAEYLPVSIDFAFVDGDHSWEGISGDWSMISKRVVESGIVCLHDAAVPAEEPWRIHDSCRFYETVIAMDSSFELIETVYSMRVLRRTTSTRLPNDSGKS